MPRTTTHFWNTQNLRRLVPTLILGGFLSLNSHAASLNIAQLMAMLAKASQGTATFTEKKYISILDEAVESSGELLFIPPARLEKRTIKPREETVVLDSDNLMLIRGKRKRALSLKDYPEVAGMIESIRATLAGDRKSLERVYHVSVDGTRARWSMVLIPLDAKVGNLVARIRIDGQEGAINTVEILQRDGDRSVMNIKKTAAPSAREIVQ